MDSVSSLQKVIGGDQEVIYAINGPYGRIWQKEKKAVVAIVYEEFGVYYFKGTVFLISPVDDDPNYVYLLTTAATIGKSGSRNFTELQENAQRTYIVFNFEEIGDVTQMYYPKDVIEKYAYKFPHVYGLQAISNTSGNYNDKHHTVLLKIPKSKIPASVKYYQLGWKLGSPFFNGRLIGDVRYYFNKMNTKSIFLLRCINNYINNKPYDEIYSSTVEQQKIDKGYIGAPVFDASKKVISTMSYFYNGHKMVYPLREMQKDYLSGFNSYISKGHTEQDGKYCLNLKVLTFSQPIYSNRELKADEKINISSTIYGGNTVAKANEEINLQAGFEVRPGASFEVSMDPCH